MIKILMIVPALNVANGVASVAMNYFRNLDASKYQIDFAVLHNTESPYIKEIESKGGTVYTLPSIKNFSEHIKCCRQIISFGDYDVVHDHSLTKTIPLMVCAKKAGVPVRILHSHSVFLSKSKVKAFLNALAFPFLKGQVNAFFACSDLTAKALFPSEDYFLIPNSIDVEKFAFSEDIRSTIRRKMNCEDKFIIGSVGRISSEKNPFFAVDVFQELLKRVPDAEYWWIGDGDLEESLRRYISDKGLEGSFKLLGRKNNVSEYYSAMDVLMLPSLFEGFPMTAVEAQDSGLPLLMSDRITKGVKLSERVYFLSLKDQPGTWAERLCQLQKTHFSRLDGNRCVSEAGYGLANMIRILEETLDELVRRHK